MQSFYPVPTPRPIPLLNLSMREACEGAVFREIILEMHRCDIDKMAFQSYLFVLTVSRIRIQAQECRATRQSIFYAVIFITKIIQNPVEWFFHQAARRNSGIDNFSKIQ